MGKENGLREAAGISEEEFQFLDAVFDGFDKDHGHSIEAWIEVCKDFVKTWDDLGGRDPHDIVMAYLKRISK